MTTSGPDSAAGSPADPRSKPGKPRSGRPASEQAILGLPAAVDPDDSQSPNEIEISVSPVSDAIPGWVRRAIFLWWGVLISVALSVLVIRELRGLLIQLVVALFLSFALEPLVNKLERRGLARGLATALTLLGTIGAAAVFFTAMGQLVATQLTELVDNIPNYLRSGQGWLDDEFGILVETDDLVSRFQDGGDVGGYATDVANQLVSAGTTVAGVLFQFLTITLFTFYFTADGPRLRRTVCSFLPQNRQTEVLRVWELAIVKTGAYISSRFLLAVFSALFHYFVFTALELPSAVALALWVGLISQFIPTLGTYLAGVLPLLVAIGIDPGKALWVLIAVVVYQQIENYLLQPRVTAQTLDLHPAVSIAAVLAGTSLFGAPGALLALPFVATAGGFFTAYLERHPVIENRLLMAEQMDERRGFHPFSRRDFDDEDDGASGPIAPDLVVGEETGDGVG